MLPQGFGVQQLDVDFRFSLADNKARTFCAGTESLTRNNPRLLF
jgi:hypothetical protein